MVGKLIRIHLIKIFFILLFFTSPAAYAEKQILLLEVAGTIGPATQDYVQRGLEYALDKKASLIILRLDTPGGLDTSMRGINKALLASPIPIVTYVSPEGARAASAGTYILYASHIAAMAKGTNLGAASPIQIGGIPEMPNPTASGDKRDKSETSTLQKKIMHDAAAYIRSLAEIQGRNSSWAEQAVREGVSLSAEEALKFKVIDVVADNLPELLKTINGRTIKVQGVPETLQLTDFKVESFNPDWRFQILSIITDPNIAYILLLIGIYGLFFEFSSPGFILPGVVGAISLLLALYAFQLLPISYAGFALLFLGIIFMIVEVFVPSFGALGIGGIIAFVAGSILLLDTGVPGYNIAWQVIFLMSLITASFFLVIIKLAIQSYRKKMITGREALLGGEGEVLEYSHKQILVRIQGEIWKAQSEKPLYPGQPIKVTEVVGLLLTVKPKDPT